jgi:hypothetical protein
MLNAHSNPHGRSPPKRTTLLTHADQSVKMILPASLSSDFDRHQIGTPDFLRRNPQLKRNSRTSTGRDYWA